MQSEYSVLKRSCTILSIAQFVLVVLVILLGLRIFILERNITDILHLIEDVQGNIEGVIDLEGKTVEGNREILDTLNSIVQYLNMLKGGG